MRKTEFEFDAVTAKGRTQAVFYEAADINQLLEERGATDERLAEPLAGEVSLRRVSGKVCVEGKLQTVLQLGCGRCLKRFEAPLETEFRFFLMGPVEQNGAGASEVELEAEDLELERLPDRLIRLEEVLLEQLVLTLPPYPVCGEGCKGLCHGCGVDLNKSACTCEAKPVDPRLAALANFKAKK